MPKIMFIFQSFIYPTPFTKGFCDMQSNFYDYEIYIYIFSKIQLVVFYQSCILIGWATSRLYVIPHK